MKVSDLASDLQRELSGRKYFVNLEIMEQTQSIIKARLYISSDLFVQVYRNDRFSTTNMAVINNGMRLFARDEVAGIGIFTPLPKNTISAPTDSAQLN